MTQDFADNAIYIPAKSISENFPWIFLNPFFLRMIWNTACDLDEWLFADVVPDVLQNKTQLCDTEIHKVLLGSL